MATRPAPTLFRNTAALSLVGALLLAVAISVSALPRLERFFLQQSAARGEATLRLAVEGLRGALRRYEPLPALIAERRILADLLADPDDESLQQTVNEQLRQTAHALSASDVYLMDISGLTLAASSYLKELSFVGRSFGYRPYFTQALDGGLGRYFALGTTSGERGYFFAAPVEDGNRIVGVVAVKFTVDDFEAAWRGGESDILVTDINDIVFMSSRPEWHFRALAPLTGEVLARIESDRQYPLAQVTPLPNSATPLGGTDAQILTIADVGATQEFVAGTMPIADAGWQVSILTPTGPAKTQARVVLAIMVLLILFAGLIVAVFLQRRLRLLERLEAQRATQDLLERRVAERTLDLNTANRQLVQEVEERRTTELQLRKTQADLVQAGKLAALGQMSAALSHEFNQPLAAVKSYADNAVTFLDRNRPEDARENVSRISQMADRMASISKHLRNFARRPQEKIGPIPLVGVLDDVTGFMAVRLKASGARLRYDRPGAEIWVLGGRVRLQQVIVNLMNNALDAMEGHAQPEVFLEVSQHGDRWQVAVRDLGTGLDEDTLAQIFDPFFTTKKPGKGLGLGLSISYNIVRDFGGRLSARNHADGGAVFVVDLQAAEAPGQSEGVAAE